MVSRMFPLLVFVLVAAIGCATAGKQEPAPLMADFISNLVGSLNAVRHGMDGDRVSCYGVIVEGTYGMSGDVALLYGSVWGLRDEEDIIPEEQNPFRHGCTWPSFLLAYTGDGGKNWLLLMPTAESHGGEVDEVRFIDEKHGWLCWHWDLAGAASGFFVTDDGGRNWIASRWVRAEPPPSDRGSLWGSVSLSFIKTWGFSSPKEGRAVLDVQTCIGFDYFTDKEEDAEAEVVYCLTSTCDGGHTWTVVDYVAAPVKDLLYGYPPVPDFVPPMKVRESAGGWSVDLDVKTGHYVVTRSADGEKKEVGFFPKILQAK